jgi:hypothetical protein
MCGTGTGFIALPDGGMIITPESQSNETVETLYKHREIYATLVYIIWHLDSYRVRDAFE